MHNINTYIHSTKKLRRKLRRIPGYANILSRRAGVSPMTIYRILKGESSPQAIDILEKASELVREYEEKMHSLTNNLHYENRN
jgi:predicted transcriptional regulator